MCLPIAALLGMLFADSAEFHYETPLLTVRHPDYEETHLWVASEADPMLFCLGNGEML